MMYGNAEDMADILRLTIERRLIELRTSFPAKVVRWDPELQVADLDPMVTVEVPLEEDGDLSAYYASPVIPSVPVIFPRNRNAFITFPLEVGDFVLVVINDRDPSGWRLTGKKDDPHDHRLHNLQNACAIAGYYPRAETVDPVDPDDIVIGFNNGNRVHVGESDTRFGGAEGAKTADKALALAQATRDELEKLRAAFNGHTHATAGTGTPSPPTVYPGAVPPPTIPVPEIADLGSTRVKTED